MTTLCSHLRHSTCIIILKLYIYYHLLTLLLLLNCHITMLVLQPHTIAVVVIKVILYFVSDYVIEGYIVLA